MVIAHSASPTAMVKNISGNGIRHAPSAAARPRRSRAMRPECFDDRQRQNCNRSRRKPIDAGADRNETANQGRGRDDADAQADERTPMVCRRCRGRRARKSPM